MWQAGLLLCQCKKVEEEDSIFHFLYTGAELLKFNLMFLYLYNIKPNM